MTKKLLTDRQTDRQNEKMTNRQTRRLAISVALFDMHHRVVVFVSFSLLRPSDYNLEIIKSLETT